MLEYGDAPIDVSAQTSSARMKAAPALFGANDVLPLLRRWKTLVLLFALGGGIFGYLLTKSLTPRYVATAQIYLDPRSLPGADKEDAAARQDSTGFINFVETQARIVTSYVVLERVVSAEHLASDPEFGGGGSLLGSFFHAGGAADSGADARAAAIRALGSRISIRRPERTFIIEISATSRDADKAARIANAIATAYIDTQSAMQSDSAKQATGSFSARLGGLRDRLIAAEKQVEDYKAANGFVGSRDQYIDDQALKDLNQQLTYARARLEEARSRYDQVLPARKAGADIGALTATLNVSTLTNLRSSQAEALQKLADLSAELGPRHPAVINATARVAEIRRLLDAELVRVAESFRKDFERARESVDGLQRKVDELKQQSLGSAQASVHLRELEREVDANKTIYESFLARSRQTAESQQLDAASTHVVTMATPPTGRSFPPSAALTTALGAIVGFLVGAALAYWQDFGAMPRLPGPVKREQRQGALRSDPFAADGKPLLEFAVTDATRFECLDLVAAHEPLTMTRLGIPVALPRRGHDEIEPLALRLLALCADNATPPTIAIVGDARDDARTIIAANLAVALGRKDLSIALVDADARNAVLSAFIEQSSGEPSARYAETCERVLLAPADGRAGSVHEIVGSLRGGDEGHIDAIICDGLDADPMTLEMTDAVVLVLDRDANAADAAAALPDALGRRIAFVLRFAHSDPWAQTGSRNLRRSA